MDVFLAWVGDDEVDLSAAGPWEEARRAAPGLWLLSSSESLSAVYHAVKWQLEQDVALVVAPVGGTPKSRGLAAGTTRWLRSRTRPHEASRHLLDE